MKHLSFSRALALTIALLLLMVAVAVGAGHTVSWAATAQMPGDAAAPAPGIHPLGDGRYLAIIPAAALPANSYNQTPYIDTYVDSTASGSSYCTDTKMAVQYNGSEFGTQYQRAFLGFHLSSIPANAIIDSATFHAYLYDAWGANPVNIALRQVTANWNCPLYWPGPKSVSYTSSSINTTHGWKSWTITSLVDTWKGKDFGKSPNYGFELRGPESGGVKLYHYRYFDTKNAKGNHPYLYVSYHLPATNTPTPKPTNTPTPQPTKTPTNTPTATFTPQLPATKTPTPTSKPTSTPTPTSKPTSTPTPTPKPTNTPTPTATFTPSSCPDDPYEPNERFEQASTLTPGTTVSAYICPDRDVDMFHFVVSSATEVDIYLFPPQNYQLALFGPDHTVLTRAGDATAHNRHLHYTATATGDYWIRVAPGSVGDASLPYSLRLELTPITCLDAYADADTYVDQENPTLTHGDERIMMVGQNEFAQQSRSLVHFDLSALPAAPITSATLLARLRGDTSHIKTVDLYRLSSAWNEDTVTWNTKPWSVDAGVSAQVGWIGGAIYSWDVRDLVQGWLTGGVGNFGLEMRPGADFAVESRIFRTKEYSDAYSPRLHVCYREPAPILGGSISGRVFEDLDNDRQYDPGEPGIAGVTLQLINAADDNFGYRTTDHEGRYTFASPSLPAAYYVLDGDRSTWIANYSGYVHDEFHLNPSQHKVGVDFPLRRRPTPTPLPPSTMDMAPQQAEFIQVVQGVPLISHKTTLVRVYVSVTGATDEVHHVTATLARTSHPLDTIDPIAPANLLPIADPAPDLRVISDLSRTINFILPDAWTGASRPNFHIVIDPEGRTNECPGASCLMNNQMDASAQFHQTQTPKIRMVDIFVDGHLPEVRWVENIRWLLKTYPLNDVDMYGGFTAPDLDFGDTGGSGCGTPWNRLLVRLGWEQFWAGDLDKYYYGVVPQAVVPTPGTVGCGRTPGHVAAGWVTVGDEEGQRTMAHELGHNLGRHHTCTPGGGEADCGWYPYSGGLMGTAYGIDLADPMAPVYIDPTTTYDIMGYSSPTWMSDYTYHQLYNALLPSAQAEQLLAAQAANAGNQDYLVAAGFIDGLTMSLSSPFYRVSLPVGSSDEPGTGLFTLTLENAQGAPLFTRHFDVDSPATDDPAVGNFMEMVPWQAGTARVVIARDQTEIYAQTVSAHAPTVTLLSPNGGESWPLYSQQTITWQGSDADDDTLHYVLQYSPDNGVTWQAIAIDLTGASYTLDVGAIPGGEQALLRVIASDGVNTAQDESDGNFTVEGKPPDVGILLPLDGGVYRPGASLLLQGFATDLEDGPISAAAQFAWTSSRDGDLGRGQNLVIDTLSPGEHTLTLRVTDSDHASAEASVDIFIGERLYLPTFMK